MTNPRQRRVDFTALTLGEDRDAVRVRDNPSLAEAAFSLCLQSRRILRVSSADLQPDVYDNDAFADAASRLARAHPHSEVRVLVSEARRIATAGHRLLDLSRRLSSIAIRELRLDDNEIQPAYLIADLCGVLLFPERSEDPALVSFYDRVQAARRIDHFDLLWQRSSSPVELRALTL